MATTDIKKILSGNNIKKTIRYFKKNGFFSAFHAVMERVSQKRADHYEFSSNSQKEWERQREKSMGAVDSLKFSILVPAYETKPEYFNEMVKSVQNQSYPYFELIIADASDSDSLRELISEFPDDRIRYRKLKNNGGISENTNEALRMAQGQYIGLLDHDDVLTPDALYEMAECIGKMSKAGKRAGLLYSDEDKGNGDMTEFYDPHRKRPYNRELFLSNNYICHFTVMEADLMKRLAFRSAYDGAQDYDLLLRAAAELEPDAQETIVHIPKVLYHWRCHTGSTAENPESKMYAYEAGRKAVADYCRKQGWHVRVKHTAHLGFYRVEYRGGILGSRPEVGAVGGPVIKHGRIRSGALEADGTVFYRNLNRHFSGYLHRAALVQETEALDLRCIKVRKEYRDELHSCLREFGLNKRRNRGRDDLWIKASLKFASFVKSRGQKLVYDPLFTMHTKLRGNEEQNAQNHDCDTKL